MINEVNGTVACRLNGCNSVGEWVGGGGGGRIPTTRPMGTVWPLWDCRISAISGRIRRSSFQPPLPADFSMNRGLEVIAQPGGGGRSWEELGGGGIISAPGDGNHGVASAPSLDAIGRFTFPPPLAADFSNELWMGSG